MRSRDATEELRASLVRAALQLVARDGADALTMRSLAKEAGCAVGLPYKVFANRSELVAAMLHVDFTRLRAGFDTLIERAGTHTVGDNLVWFAELLLGSPTVNLAHEVHADPTLDKTANAEFHGTGIAAAFDTALPDYLAAEKRAGRVGEHVDEKAFGFVLVGALHNLLAAGEDYPRPSPRELRRLLRAVAAGLAPTTQPKKRRKEGT